MSGLAGLGALALALAGCSPGSMTIGAIGSTTSPKDALIAKLTCTDKIGPLGTTSNQNNCTGTAFGLIQGKSFIMTGFSSGGFADQRTQTFIPVGPPIGSVPVPGDCVSAPCSTYAVGSVSGSGRWGTMPVSVHLTAYDNWPATSSPDTVRLSLSAIGADLGVDANFTCSNNCVTIHMLPGSIPGTY